MLIRFGLVLLIFSRLAAADTKSDKRSDQENDEKDSFGLPSLFGWFNWDSKPDDGVHHLDAVANLTAPPNGTAMSVIDQEFTIYDEDETTGQNEAPVVYGLPASLSSPHSRQRRAVPTEVDLDLFLRDFADQNDHFYMSGEIVPVRAVISVPAASKTLDLNISADFEGNVLGIRSINVSHIGRNLRETFNVLDFHQRLRRHYIGIELAHINIELSLEGANTFTDDEDSQIWLDLDILALAALRDEQIYWIAASTFDSSDSSIILRQVSVVGQHPDVVEAPFHDPTVHFITDLDELDRQKTETLFVDVYAPDLVTDISLVVEGPLDGDGNEMLVVKNIHLHETSTSYSGVLLGRDGASIDGSEGSLRFDLQVVSAGFRSCAYPRSSYLGCMNEGDPHVLPLMLDHTDWAPEYCMWRCAHLGHTYADLNVGDECWCGHDPYSSSTGDAPYGYDSDSVCHYACGSGHNSQQIGQPYCGGYTKAAVLDLHACHYGRPFSYEDSRLRFAIQVIWNDAVVDSHGHSADINIDVDVNGVSAGSTVDNVTVGPLYRTNNVQNPGVQIKKYPDWAIQEGDELQVVVNLTIPAGTRNEYAINIYVPVVDSQSCLASINVRKIRHGRNVLMESIPSKTRENKRVDKTKGFLRDHYSYNLRIVVGGESYSASTDENLVTVVFGLAPICDPGSYSLQIEVDSDYFVWTEELQYEVTANLPTFDYTTDEIPTLTASLGDLVNNTVYSGQIVPVVLDLYFPPGTQWSHSGLLLRTPTDSLGQPVATIAGLSPTWVGENLGPSFVDYFDPLSEIYRSSYITELKFAFRSSSYTYLSQSSDIITSSEVDGYYANLFRLELAVKVFEHGAIQQNSTFSIEASMELKSSDEEVISLGAAVYLNYSQLPAVDPVTASWPWKYDAGALPEFSLALQGHDTYYIEPELATRSNDQLTFVASLQKLPAYRVLDADFYLLPTDNAFQLFTKTVTTGQIYEEVIDSFDPVFGENIGSYLMPLAGPDYSYGSVLRNQTLNGPNGNMAKTDFKLSLKAITSDSFKFSDGQQLTLFGSMYYRDGLLFTDTTYVKYNSTAETTITLLEDSDRPEVAFVAEQSTLLPGTGSRFFAELTFHPDQAQVLGSFSCFVRITGNNVSDRISLDGVRFRPKIYPNLEETFERTEWFANGNNHGSVHSVYLRTDSFENRFDDSGLNVRYILEGVLNVARNALPADNSPSKLELQVIVEFSVDDQQLWSGSLGFEVVPSLDPIENEVVDFQVPQSVNDVSPIGLDLVLPPDGVPRADGLIPPDGTYVRIGESEKSTYYFNVTIPPHGVNWYNLKVTANAPTLDGEALLELSDLRLSHIGEQMSGGPKWWDAVPNAFVVNKSSTVDVNQIDSISATLGRWSNTGFLRRGSFVAAERFVGCYAGLESDDYFTQVTSWKSFSARSCSFTCSGLGYAFSMLSALVECRCGNSFSTAARLPTDRCHRACTPGMKNERKISGVNDVDGLFEPYCGGAGDTFSNTTYDKAQSIFDVRGLFVDTPVTVTFNATNQFVGCQERDSNWNYMDAIDQTTCVRLCDMQGTSFAGFNEQGCFCLQTVGSLVDQSNCNSSCNGFQEPFCGDSSDFVSVFAVQRMASIIRMEFSLRNAYMGCYLPGDSHSWLSLASNKKYFPMHYSCAAFCYGLGQVFIAMSENKCYCLKNLDHQVRSKVPDSDCAFECRDGGAGQPFCGDSNRWSVFDLRVFYDWVSDEDISSGAVAAPLPLPSINAADMYIGCFIDAADRDVQDTYFDTSPDDCIQYCALRGNFFAAIQAGAACFCGDSFGKHGTDSHSSCSNQCTHGTNIGRPYCGAGFRNSIFDIGEVRKAMKLRSHYRSLDVLQLAVDVMVSDHSANINHTRHEFSVSVEYRAGHTITAVAPVTVLEPKVRRAVLHLNTSVIERSDNAVSLRFELRHAWSSTAAAYNAKVVIRLPYFSQLVETRFEGREPTMLHRSEVSTLELTYAKVLLRDSNAIITSLLIDPRRKFEPGEGVVHVTVPVHAVYWQNDKAAELRGEGPRPMVNWFNWTATELVEFEFLVPELYPDLGMRGGHITALQLGASSWKVGHEPNQARPDGTGWITAYRGSPYSNQEFLEIDLLTELKLTGITLYAVDEPEGNRHGQISVLTLRWSPNGIDWFNHLDFDGNTVRSFHVQFSINTENETESNTTYPKQFIPIVGYRVLRTRYLRVVPKANTVTQPGSTARQFALKLELHGYKMPWSSRYETADCVWKRPLSNGDAYCRVDYLATYDKALDICTALGGRPALAHITELPVLWETFGAGVTALHNWVSRDPDSGAWTEEGFRKFPDGDGPIDGGNKSVIVEGGYHMAVDDDYQAYPLCKKDSYCDWKMISSGRKQICRLQVDRIQDGLDLGQAACSSHDGELFKIESTTDKDGVFDAVAGQGFPCLINAVQDGSFQWSLSDGRPLPDDLEIDSSATTSSAPSLMVNPISGKMTPGDPDHHCVLCQKRNVCTWKTEPATGKRFCGVYQLMSRDEARSVCEQHGGQLVSLRNTVDKEFVSSMFADATAAEPLQFWMGAQLDSDLVDSELFPTGLRDLWGRPLEYTDPFQADGSEGDCLVVSLADDGAQEWHAVDCEAVEKFGMCSKILEKDSWGRQYLVPKEQNGTIIVCQSPAAEGLSDWGDGGQSTDGQRGDALGKEVFSRGAMTRCSATSDWGQSWQPLAEEIVSLIGYDQIEQCLVAFGRGVVGSAVLGSYDLGSTFEELDEWELDGFLASPNFTRPISLPFDADWLKENISSLFREFGAAFDWSYWSVDISGLYVSAGATVNITWSESRNVTWTELRNVTTTQMVNGTEQNVTELVEESITAERDFEFWRLDPANSGVWEQVAVWSDDGLDAWLDEDD